MFPLDYENAKKLGLVVAAGVVLFYFNQRKQDDKLPAKTSFLQSRHVRKTSLDLARQKLKIIIK